VYADFPHQELLALCGYDPLTSPAFCTSGDSSGFPFEAFGEALRGDFDRHVAMEAEVARAEDLADAAFADGRQDFAGSGMVAGGEGHMTQNSLLAQGE